LSGKRVLDLGCGDAYYSMQMLRHGAREVTGIEDDPERIEHSLFIKEAFEWADSTTYGFKQVPVRMEELPTLDLGRFDLVTALNGLYHMDHELIERVVGYVSEITDCFVVLCQGDPTNGSLETNRRKTVDYYLQVLERHGFDIGCIVPSPGYSWLLVTGTRP
jgi:SAM-dependent methyltransferase